MSIEEAIKKCMGWHGSGPSTKHAIQKVKALMIEYILKERESCASLCEDTDQEYELYVGTPIRLNYTCASAIRKRPDII